DLWWRGQMVGEREAPRRDRRKGEGPRHTGQLTRDVDVKLHLRMDAAEHKKRAGGGKADFDGLARLLRAGIEVERGIEYPDVVGAGVVVDNPQSPAARQRNMLGGESLVVLGHGADLFRRSRRANLHRCDLVRQ